MNGQLITIDAHDDPNPYTMRTFTVHFFNLDVHTTVTSKPSVVRKWLHHVLRLHRTRRHKLVVGLGVQWRPASSADPKPPPATLQLCIGSYCLVFQLLYTDSVPLVLRRFLNDPRNTFVGVWNYRDAAMLWRSKHSLFVNRIVDIRDVAAERRGLSKKLSMDKLARVVLGVDGVKKPKSIARSDWDEYWLNACQVQYACVDAVVSFSLGKDFQAWTWN